ncbi:MAG: ATP-dependent Clp protease ATP-binding subunit [Patescibacteria group bacterium]
MKSGILDKFTSHLKDALDRAGRFAIDLRSQSVNPEHMLYGLAESKGGIAYDVLNKAGVRPEMFRMAIRRRSEHLTPTGNPTGDLKNIKFSDTAKRAIEKSVLIAHRHKHKYIGTEHLLEGLLTIADITLNKILEEHNISSEDVKKQIKIVLKSTSRFPDLTGFFDTAKDTNEISFEETLQQKPSKNPALDFFARDLTDERAQKMIDPVVGRDEEIERLTHILSRRTKNNPVLIGDPGVGKTAIVEGLAKNIHEGKVPDVLADKRLLALDLSLIVAGTIYRGEFESRLKQIIEEIKEDPNIIVFIDELHNIMGAGAASGSMDAANILKPTLAKGDIRVIGATTLEEYRKHIESDAALERRFQPIIVDEPTPEETIKILQGIKKNYEVYHHIAITEEAIDEAVKLSVRYIQDKFLPDKAIDLIDEAASKKKVGLKPSPTARKIKQLEDKISNIQKVKRDYVLNEDFERAFTIKAQEQQLTDKLIELREKELSSDDKLRDKIIGEDIAALIAKITGVPITELIKAEKEQLLNLEEKMHENIKGQEEAIQSLADFIRRARVGLANQHRPIGSFLFLGPSGVGKTETAKVLANTVFNDKDALIRIDMSEFGESFNVSKLIGAPAGYVGYKEGNKLTDTVRRKPYSVVLFDEIEKAHPDVFNLLLQVLDDGVLTDAAGKKVNFKNTIIILTSNIGIENLNRVAGMGFSTDSADSQEKAEDEYQKIRDQVLEQLSKTFRPEFLNRLDKTLVFRPLTIKVMRLIVDRQLAELNDRLQTQSITLRMKPSVKNWLAEKGYSPDQGARGLQRLIQDKLENPLAKFLLDNNDTKDIIIDASLSKDTIQLKRI